MRAREHAADLHRVRSAPRPSGERKQAARLQIASAREAAIPNVSVSLWHGHDIQFATEDLQVSIHNAGPAIGFAEIPNTLGLISWLFHDQLLAAIDHEIDAEADDKIALTNADRQKAEAVILGDAMQNERCECALIALARSQNSNTAYRPNCSPLALLGVQLVQGQGRPTMLSLVIGK